jgi:hypothetical protein
MGLRGSDRSSRIPSRLDLLRRHLRLSAWIFLGLDSRSHFRVVNCCGDDLFVAAGSGGASLFDLSRIWNCFEVITGGGAQFYAAFFRWWRDLFRRLPNLPYRDDGRWRWRA